MWVVHLVVSYMFKFYSKTQSGYESFMKGTVQRDAAVPVAHREQHGSGWNCRPRTVKAATCTFRRIRGKSRREAELACLGTRMPSREQLPPQSPLFAWVLSFCESRCRAPVLCFAFLPSPLSAFQFWSLLEDLGVWMDFFARLASPKMAVDLKGWWRQKREGLASQQLESTVPSFFIPSPVEGRDVQETIEELRAARAKHCTDEGIKAGLKSASIACVAAAIPTLTAVRTVPWVKAHLNYTGQALVISAATIATYFIVVDQTILECSRKGSWDALEKRRSAAS